MEIIEFMVATVVSSVAIVIGYFLLKGGLREHKYYKKGLGRKILEYKNGKWVFYFGGLTYGMYVTSKPTKSQRFSLLTSSVSGVLLGLFAIATGSIIILIYCLILIRNI